MYRQLIWEWKEIRRNPQINHCSKSSPTPPTHPPTENGIYSPSREACRHRRSLMLIEPVSGAGGLAAWLAEGEPTGFST